MGVELTYTAVCRNNGLTIFDGLSADELQTGRRLYEDVTDFANSIGRSCYCTRYVIGDRHMLVAVLKLVENECRSGTLFPALHFECHGDVRKGLLLARSKEYIPWADLMSLIAPLNAATRNNTAVVLASCNGYELSSLVSLRGGSPFHFVIAPNEEMTAGALIDTLLPFYREVMSTGDLSTAISHLDVGFKHFVCGERLYSAVASFMINNFTAKLRQEMVEEMVSNEMARLGYQNRDLVRIARSRARKYLANPRNFFRRLSKEFFHGQEPVPYDNFEAFVKDQKRRI